MRYGSVCSGIEAASVAWRGLGWRAAFHSEIEAFPRAVLKHHWADTPLHGDFTTINEGDYDPIDILVGGTPCQDFSIAGLRAGMVGDRGNLTLQFLALARRLRPEWLVWENVPGVLSINDGRDFGAFLGGLGELGFGWAYRTLDAQYFGVPQRRRRVFVVGHLGDWRRAAAVLFERHSLQGHSAPRREAGKRVAPTISSRPTGGGGLGTDFDCDGGLIASTGDVSHCLNGGGMGRQDYETETLISHALTGGGFDASEDGTGRGTPLVTHFQDSEYGCKEYDTAAIRAGRIPEHSMVLAFAQNQRDELREMEVAGSLAAEPGMKQQTYIAFSAKDSGADALEDLSPTLRAGAFDKSHANAGVMPAVAYTLHGADKTISTATQTDLAGSIRTKPPGSIENSSTTVAFNGSAVRRLTPRECERLQGFEDDYTLVPYRGKPAADGPRYKALGNSMAVPVMRWIGERIEAVTLRGD